MISDCAVVQIIQLSMIIFQSVFGHLSSFDPFEHPGKRRRPFHRSFNLGGSGPFFLAADSYSRM